jgi:hypothetical protein
MRRLEPSHLIHASSGFEPRLVDIEIRTPLVGGVLVVARLSATLGANQRLIRVPF